MAKTDIQLKRDIEEELRWDPKVNAAQIGVSVDEGAVSLLEAVYTARSVRGLAGIVGVFNTITLTPGVRQSR